VVEAGVFLLRVVVEDLVEVLMGLTTQVLSLVGRGIHQLFLLLKEMMAVIRQTLQPEVQVVGVEVEAALGVQGQPNRFLVLEVRD
jgi:hypothetical protein